MGTYWLIMALFIGFIVVSAFDTDTAEDGLNEAVRVCRSHGGIRQAQLSTAVTADYVICIDGHADSLD